MRKLVFLLIGVVLLIFAFSKYKNYKKFRPPSSYDRPLNTGVDANYHNPGLLKDYYEQVYEIASFARRQWFNHGVDVLFADEKNEKSLLAVEVYNKMLANADYLEAKLLASALAKKSGLNNSDIQQIEQKGISIKEALLSKQIGSLELKFGDKGTAVKKLQEALVENGFKITVDGVYNVQTQNAVVEFQNKHNLFPSGSTNKELLMLLLK